jgi:rhodanese-related sulfurtransferase
VIDGALLIDFHGDDFFKRIAALDRERPVYLYCAVGGRSHLAAVQLLKLGHAQVVDLDGGIEAWVEAGYPVVLPGKTGNR